MRCQRFFSYSYQIERAVSVINGWLTPAVILEKKSRRLPGDRTRDEDIVYRNMYPISDHLAAAG